MRPPNSFKIVVRRWFNGIWCEHKLLEQFSSLYKSTMENFCKTFFDNVTTYNDEICYAKHVLALFYVFFTLFGCWGGGVGGKWDRLTAWVGEWCGSEMNDTVRSLRSSGTTSRTLKSGLTSVLRGAAMPPTVLGSRAPK